MRYELADYEWTVIKPILPNKPRGVPRVATRYDRLAASYLAFVQLASIRLWLRLVRVLTFRKPLVIEVQLRSNARYLTRDRRQAPGLAPTNRVNTRVKWL
jgi:hypothetical protein